MSDKIKRLAFDAKCSCCGCPVEVEIDSQEEWALSELEKVKAERDRAVELLCCSAPLMWAELHMPAEAKEWEKEAIAFVASLNNEEEEK